MSYNDAAIAAAIATRVATVTVPAGVPAIRGATSTPPDVLQVLPYAIVLPGSDQIIYGAASRIITGTFTVRLYLGSPTDFARRFPALHAYRTALRDIFLGATTLGGLVDQVSVINTSIATDDYGGSELVVVDVTVEATKGESYNASA
jgi:hypothetical protein